MKDRELVKLLIHLVELEAALSKRNVRAGREAFYEAVWLVTKAIDRLGRR